MKRTIYLSSEKRERLKTLERATSGLPPLRLTPRDIAIVQAVYQCRALTSEHIRALYFPTKAGRTHCQMRLKLLFHHGYLFRDERPTKLTEGRRPLVYSLDQRGAALLQERGLWQEEIIWKPGHNRVGSSFIEHLLRTNDVRAAMVVAAGKGGFTIKKWLDDGTLKHRQMKDYVTIATPGGRHRKVAVIPDGYFVLDLGEKRAHFFIEVDMATLAHRRWKTRVQAYLAYAGQGLYQKKYQTRSLRILTITTGERRLENLITTTEAADGQRMFWFTTFGQASPERILTKPIWQVAGQEGKQSLIY